MALEVRLQDDARLTKDLWRFGYLWALGLMAAGTGGLWLYFKRNGWL